jgi:hypothetical protein
MTEKVQNIHGVVAIVDEKKKNDDQCNESELLPIIIRALNCEHLTNAFDGSKTHTQQLLNKKQLAPETTGGRLISS